MSRRLRGLALLLLTLLRPAPAAALPTAVDGPRTLRTDATGERRVPGGQAMDVAPDGTMESVRVDTTSATYGKVTVYFSTCVAERTTPDGKVSQQVLARWNTGQLAPVTWQPHVARFTPNGHFLSLVTVGGALWVLRDHRPWRRLTVKRSLPVAEARLLLDAADEPLVFVRQPMSYTIEFVRGPDAFETVLEGIDYDWSAARTETGDLYVSGYDYAERSLVVGAAVGGKAPWRRLAADTRESGWQHTVIAAGDAAYVLSYYFRNAFNRGLTLVTLRAGDIADRHTWLRLRDENGGWSPTLATLPDGRVRVSQRAREQAEDDRVETFPDLAAFLARRAEESTGAWEDEYRDWSVSLAFLPRYRFWSLTSPRPAVSDTPFQPNLRYDYDPALEFGGSIEGRIGSWDLGLMYLQSLLDGPAGTGVQLLSGWIGVDQLLFGHDLKISTSQGTYHGTATSKTGEVDATTDVTEVEVRLLNQWRIGYGLSYRRYTLPLPYYVYRAPRDVPEYGFVGGEVADATAQRWELFVGYARIDYLTKYENSFNGLDLDIRGGFGLSVLDWREAVWDGEHVDGTLDLALSAQMRLGYVVYHRFYGLQGAGFFVRGGYEGTWMGSGLDNELPAPRDPDDGDLGSKAVTISAAHHQLFHGPYLSLGLVY